MITAMIIPVLLSKLDENIVMIFLVGLCLVSLAVSYLISLHIMEKKEY